MTTTTTVPHGRQRVDKMWPTLRSAYATSASGHHVRWWMTVVAAVSVMSGAVALGAAANIWNWKATVIGTAILAAVAARETFTKLATQFKNPHAELDKAMDRVRKAYDKVAIPLTVAFTLGYGSVETGNNLGPNWYWLPSGLLVGVTTALFLSALYVAAE